MIRFTLQPEPDLWDTRCRKRGHKWLKDHPDFDRPSDYWTEFEPNLREAFGGICAFCAMFIMKGEMDHFLPIAHLKKKKKTKLAYEWDNFRYVEGVINQRKSDHLVLDPFKVKDNWFEILLPSLQLRLTDKVPKTQRKKAQFTLEKLGLQNDEVVIRYRQSWFDLYRNRQLTLEGLEERAPLIARAIQRDLDLGKDWRYPPSEEG